MAPLLSSQQTHHCACCPRPTVYAVLNWHTTLMSNAGANLHQERFVEPDTGDNSPQQATSHSEETDLVKAHDATESASNTTLLDTDNNSDATMRSQDQQTTARKRR